MEESNGRKFSPCRFIGLAGVLFVIVISILACGCGGAFIHIPSLAFTFGIAFFALLATFGTDFLKFLLESFLTLFTSRPKPNPKFAEIALFASRYIIGAGVIGMFVGLVAMLRNLSDPSSLGAGMAVALLTVFYAVASSEILCVFLYKAYSDGSEPASKPMSAKGLTIASMTTLLVLVSFFVLLTSFICFNECKLYL
jgi:flagellar motor component MotA